MVRSKPFAYRSPTHEDRIEAFKGTIYMSPMYADVFDMNWQSDRSSTRSSSPEREDEMVIDAGDDYEEVVAATELLEHAIKLNGTSSHEFPVQREMQKTGLNTTRQLLGRSLLKKLGLIYIDRGTHIAHRENTLGDLYAALQAHCGAR